MKVLLDTNAYSALMRGDSSVANRVRKSADVLMSAVVVGELLFGFRNGSRYAKNVKELETFLQNPYVTFVPVSWTTADRLQLRQTDGLKPQGRVAQMSIRAED